METDSTLTQDLDIPGSPEAPETIPGTIETAVAEETQTRPLAPQGTPDAGGNFLGTGRRKASIARVRVKPGGGKFLVNKRELEDYFNELQQFQICRAAIEATEMQGKVDVSVTVTGGGLTGQSEAILLGMARALKNYDPTVEPVLREKGYLSRDPRRVERKKYGQRGARRRFQFSKR